MAENKVGIQGVAGVGRVAGEERAAQHIGIEVPFVAKQNSARRSRLPPPWFTPSRLLREPLFRSDLFQSPRLANVP